MSNIHGLLRRYYFPATLDFPVRSSGVHFARLLKWLWKQAKSGFGTGARSFED